MLIILNIYLVLQRCNHIFPKACTIFTNFQTSKFCSLLSRFLKFIPTLLISYWTLLVIEDSVLLCANIVIVRCKLGNTEVFIRWKYLFILYRIYVILRTMLYLSTTLFIYSLFITHFSYKKKPYTVFLTLFFITYGILF